MQSDLVMRRWRRTRRAAREGFTRPVVRDYHPILQKEAILLASALLLNSEDRDMHFQRCTASATLSILYDYPTLETINDATLKEIHLFNDRGSAASSPGAHLVEVFPWMMHIPDRFVQILLTASQTRLMEPYQPGQVET
jgi:cytochrome P450